MSIQTGLALFTPAVLAIVCYSTVPGVQVPTCQVLDHGCHVDGRAHANAVLVCPPPQVPHHPAHREDDPGPPGPRLLGAFLLSPSG